MANKIFRATNGVSFGAMYTAVAADASVVGSAEVLTITVTTGASASGNVGVTLRGGTIVNIAVLSTDTTPAQVATKIAGGTYPAYNATVNGAVVTFTCKTTGVKSGTNSTTVNATGVVVSAYTVVAGVGAGSIAFQFNGVGSIPVPYPIVANIRVVTAANVNVDLADAVISYPSNGVVTISSGATFTVTAGYIFSVVAQRVDSIVE